MAPLIELLTSVLWLYKICLIVWTILSTLISFRIVNAYQPAVLKIMYALDKLCEPLLRPIRRFLPDLGGLDISPIILILLIHLLQGYLAYL